MTSIWRPAAKRSHKFLDQDFANARRLTLGDKHYLPFLDLCHFAYYIATHDDHDHDPPR
jgi:hypothetical protein